MARCGQGGRPGQRRAQDRDDGAHRLRHEGPDPPADLKAKPFLWRNLSDVQKLNLSKTSAAPAGDPADGERILNYLRGDRTYESTTAVSNLYRQRASLLGDIVDSKVVYLGKPSASYAESYNPGYTRFKSDKASRKPLIFVGANDGMLHAFDASEGASGGQEVFAVVPYSVYEGPDLNPEGRAVCKPLPARTIRTATT